MLTWIAPVALAHSQPTGLEGEVSETVSGSLFRTGLSTSVWNKLAERRIESPLNANIGVHLQATPR